MNEIVVELKCRSEVYREECKTLRRQRERAGAKWDMQLADFESKHKAMLARKKRDTKGLMDEPNISHTCTAYPWSRMDQHQHAYSDKINATASVASPPMSSVSRASVNSHHQLSSRQEKRRFDYWQSSMPDLDPPHWGVQKFGEGEEARNYS